MLPDRYEHRHRSQDTGFAGEDLAKRHTREVLASAQAISRDSMTPLGDGKFHVVSQSIPGRNYLVDIRAATCDCLDFPRVRLCKHLAAVRGHISQSQDSQIQDPINTQIRSQLPPRDASSDDLSEEESQLPRVSNSETGTQSGALPKRERLSPNRNLWRDTSRNMNVRISPRRRQRPPTPPVLPNSTARHIGPSGKRKLPLYPDPYGGGEQSGKRAKPDALSPAANDHAREARMRSLALSQDQSQGQ